MSVFQFNLKDLFAKQYGYIPEEFPINEKTISKATQSGKYGSYYAYDALGRQVFMPVTLGGVFLPYVWIKITASKRIVQTAMTERRGSVKEIIATDDYKINLQGFVIGHDGQFPEQDVEDLKNLFEQNRAIPIKCPLTDIFLLTPEQNGQDKVVITDFVLHENQGVEHVRGFEMNLVSDQDFVLEII